ncbi:MAG: acyl-CoA/acyl-ACP dehydrogenase [Chloroflexi bacterium]|nr:acyl-CoA/acyl-ACP dehydrogenase [Chloroflexota bacterium]MDE2651607.1 acyl-CoA/acyl-ACP dehydrogenase [Chloroflexota bacterium]
MFVTDSDFGNIVDFDHLRGSIRHLYDALLPDFNMHKSLQVGTALYGDEPDLMIAAGASMLAWMTIIAAGEDEIAEELKDSLFTLGWTEEEIGSDLLSASTIAKPLSTDPNCADYHIKGRKWLINNSYHADYHTIVAKTDPASSGPRSLSIFLVPQSSCKNWQRLETHVLSRMVLTSFDIDGPGRLLGKLGHGLQILQRMAMPSKYQCAYVGIKLLNEAIPASIDHLSKKRIFNENPINFSNVLRQMYNLVLQGAVLNFIYYRALAFSAGSFLQFHGVMLKSWLLLRANELLGQNLLVVGSKGFLAESVIGRNAIDSFVLPVFDGHYTINTLMTAKHVRRYLGASRRADVEGRMATLHNGIATSRSGDQIHAKSRRLRNPDFFDYARYIDDLDLPLPLDAKRTVDAMSGLHGELLARELMTDPEHRYKLGTLLHWMEALLAACELWKASNEPHFLNAVVMQHNAFVAQFNQVISESALETPYLRTLRQKPLQIDEEPREFLLRLYARAQEFARKPPSPSPLPPK